MAGPFESPYSDEQRDAVTTAYLDRGIRPAKRVSALARAGELTHGDEKLDPFTVGENTIRDWARHRRRQRAGEDNGKLSQLPPLDAVEAIRRRLINAIDSELGHLERAQNRRKPLTDKQLATMARVADIASRAAKIPAPTDPKPQPGRANTIGSPQPGPNTIGSKLLAAHARNPETGSAHVAEGGDAVSTPAEPDGAPLLNHPSSTHERGTVSPTQRSTYSKADLERSLPVSTPTHETHADARADSDAGSSMRA